MDQIPDLLERIHNTHGIEFVDYDISFKGICPKCREKVKEEKQMKYVGKDQFSEN